MGWWIQFSCYFYILFPYPISYIVGDYRGETNLINSLKSHIVSLAAVFGWRRIIKATSICQNFVAFSLCASTVGKFMTVNIRLRLENIARRHTNKMNLRQFYIVIVEKKSLSNQIWTRLWTWTSKSDARKTFEEVGSYA